MPLIHDVKTALLVRYEAGLARVSVRAEAGYGERSASTTLDVEPSEALVEALAALHEEHRAAAEQRAELAAYEAATVAQRRGEAI